MRYLIVTVVISVLLFSCGCNSSKSPLNPSLVDELVGDWTGTLDYTPSGGAATPMTMTLTEFQFYYVRAVMTSGNVIYIDEKVTENDADDLVFNFPVTGETWQLVLEGSLSGTTLSGEIIQREKDEADIALGTWTASPA